MGYISWLKKKEDTLSRIRKYRKASVAQHLNTDCGKDPIGDTESDAFERFSNISQSPAFSLDANSAARRFARGQNKSVQLFFSDTGNFSVYSEIRGYFEEAYGCVFEMKTSR